MAKGVGAISLIGLMVMLGLVAAAPEAARGRALVYSYLAAAGVQQIEQALVTAVVVAVVLCE